MNNFRPPTYGLPAALLGTPLPSPCAPTLLSLIESSTTNQTLPNAPVAGATSRWTFVRQRFGQLINNIGMMEGRLEDGNTKQAGVRACLNRAYWSISSERANSFLVGSWGKQTRVRPSMDVDVMFILPDEVWRRFENRASNKQSQLLQEVRGVLEATYSQTKIRGDGQVVIVPFDSIPVEVVPAFRCADGRLIICDTKNDGRYKYADPLAEISALDAADASYSGNARALTRMMKKWQQCCGAPIKAFQLERLAIEFLATCSFSNMDHFWYDWLVRDFFGYLCGRANSFVCMPGTGEWIALGDEWLPDAKRAFAAAVLACIHEDANRETAAGNQWQEIFGSAVPVQVQ